jgi:hypothetical protein
LDDREAALIGRSPIQSTRTAALRSCRVAFLDERPCQLRWNVPARSGPPSYGFFPSTRFGVGRVYCCKLLERIDLDRSRGVRSGPNSDRGRPSESTGLSLRPHGAELARTRRDRIRRNEPLARAARGRCDPRTGRTPIQLRESLSLVPAVEAGTRWRAGSYRDLYCCPGQPPFMGSRVARFDAPKACCGDEGCGCGEKPACAPT